MKQTASALGTEKVGKLVLKLAFPAVIAQFINLLYNLVDRMYVGAIPGAGTDALAGLGVVLPITLLLSAFGNLVGMGGAPLASMYLGENRRDEAETVFNTGFILLLVFSAALTVVGTCLGDRLLVLFGAPESSFGYASEYLFIYALGTPFVLLTLGLNPFITAQGHSLTSMFTVLIGAALNIALDPLFIFTFDMGVGGAAVATVMSQAVSAIWVVVFFIGKKSEFSFRFRGLRRLPRVAGRILLLGLSPFIMAITESAIQIVFNVNLNKYTSGNAAYTAALTIMLSANQMICMPLNGLGNGVQPLVSYNLGAGNSKRIKDAVRLVSLIALSVSVTVWLVSLFAPEVYGYIFSADDAVMELVKRYTPVFMMGTVCFFAQMTLQNVFVALGQAGISIFLATLRKIILLIPLCFILPIFMGAGGVYYSEGIADIIAGITTASTFFIMLPRILKRRERELGISGDIARGAN